MKFHYGSFGNSFRIYFHEYQHGNQYNLRKEFLQIFENFVRLDLQKDDTLYILSLNAFRQGEILFGYDWIQVRDENYPGCDMFYNRLKKYSCDNLHGRIYNRYLITDRYVLFFVKYYF